MTATRNEFDYEPVTDPEILAQLDQLKRPGSSQNASPSAAQELQRASKRAAPQLQDGEEEPVTDPDIIARLNAMKASTADTLLGSMPRPKSKDMRSLLRTAVGRTAFPQTPEEQREASQVRNDKLRGIVNALANYPIDIVNLVKQNPLGRFNLAPQNEAGRIGETLGNMGTFFLPGEAAKLGIKGLQYAPGIGKGVNALSNVIRGNPFLRGTANIGRTAGETGLYSATQEPENALGAGLKGAGLGAGMQTTANFLTTPNPIVRLAAKLGLGAMIGHMYGAPGYGAMGGLVAPQLLEMFSGKGENALAEDALTGLESPQARRETMRSVAANRRLGTTLTPGQASGNYVIAGKEGALKRSEQGAQEGIQQEQKQLRQQRNALNNMLENIYKPTPQNEARITQLYNKANQKSINPDVVEKLKDNPIMASAIKTVKSDPAFSNIPENNYEFLAEVDRQLFRDQQAALKNRPNSAHAVGNVKTSFNNFLKQINPDYEAATQAAQPKMVRQKIENRFNKLEEEMTGKNFYNKFLNTRKSYQDILQDTKNFPEAQEAIKDMRRGWKHLSNIKTPSQAESQAKTGLSQARSTMTAIMEAMQRYAGAKNDVKALKYIYHPEWEHGFKRIMEIKDQQKRNRELATFIGKLGAWYGLLGQQDQEAA